MATSGTFIWNPTIAEAVDEAFERCGINPENITSRHARGAIRSLNYMVSQWSNRGILQWTVDLIEQETTVNMQSFTPPAGTIDLLDVTLLRNGYETPMVPMSRDQYATIPNKEFTGLPNQYFVQRLREPEVYIWPCADRDTDVIKYYRLRAIEDIGVLSNTPDIPRQFEEAFASGLAAKVAEKFAPDRASEMATKAEIAFQIARAESRERAEMVTNTRQGVYRAGRR